MRRLSSLILITAALCCSNPASIAQTQPAPRKAVLCSLQSKVDTKSAKAGDVIVVRTMAKSTLKDGTPIPSGARILGKITYVQSKKDGNGRSLLSIRFDQIELKGKPPISAQGALVAIAPPPAASGDLPTSSTSMRAQGLNTMTNYGHSDDDMAIPFGSTVTGVGLGDRVGADGTSQLQGKDKDIKLDQGALAEIAFL